MKSLIRVGQMYVAGYYAPENYPDASAHSMSITLKGNVDEAHDFWNETVKTQQRILSLVGITSSLFVSVEEIKETNHG